MSTQKITGRLLTALVLLALSVVFPFGEATAVTLNEALEVAMESNPEIRALESALLAAGEDVGAARSRLLPKVTFQERYMRTDNPTMAFSAKLNQERFAQTDFAIDSLNNPEPVDDFQTSVSVQQALFAKPAYVGIRMARWETKAAGLDLQRKREEVALAVTRAYLGVRSSTEFLNAAEKGLEDAREQHRAAQARLDSGIGLYSDTLRTEVAVNEARERLVSAERAFGVSRRALGLAMGTGEAVEAEDEDIELVPLELMEYTALAQNRSDVRAMALRVENAENNIDLARAGYYPMVGIGGGYQYNDHSGPFGTEGQSYHVMASLSWDIFDGSLRRHKLARAKHKAQEAEQYLDGLRKKALFDVQEGYLSMEEARQGLELARSRLSLAEEGRRLVMARYENSLSTVIEMLDAQARLDAARADVTGKHNDYLLAVAELGYRSGTILDNHFDVPDTYPEEHKGE